jgi:hypothetical protein
MGNRYMIFLNKFRYSSARGVKIKIEESEGYEDQTSMLNLKTFEILQRHWLVILFRVN